MRYNVNWWIVKESNLTAATQHIKATVLQTAVGNTIQNLVEVIGIEPIVT